MKSVETLQRNPTKQVINPKLTTFLLHGSDAAYGLLDKFSNYTDVITAASLNLSIDSVFVMTAPLTSLAILATEHLSCRC